MPASSPFELVRCGPDDADALALIGSATFPGMFAGNVMLAPATLPLARRTDRTLAR